MKTVLVIGYHPYASLTIRAPFAPTGYTIILHHFNEIIAQGITDYIQEVVRVVRNGKLHIDGVAGTGDLSSIVASVVSWKLGLPCMRPDQLALSYNKYYAREIQQQVAPEHTPVFWDARELPPHVCYPLFAKPIRANLSQGARVIRTRQELDEMANETHAMRSLQEKLYTDLVSSDEIFAPHRALLTDNGILVEELLLGQQYTVDGFVCDGNVTLLGITESFFLPDSLSFSLFVTPAQTTRKLSNRIAEVCQTVLGGLGLDNTVFNMEYRYDPMRQSLGIIELHARPSMQFVPLIFWTTGLNPLSVLCDLSVGKAPVMRYKKPRGVYAMSRPLRMGTDALAMRVPTREHVAALEEQYDALIFPLVEHGKMLSSYEQDTSSYRYAIINTYGKSVEDAMNMSRAIEQRLNYEFKPVS